MYQIINQLSDETYLAQNNGALYVLKRIDISDTYIIRALMSINNPYVVHFIEFTTIEDKFYCVEEYIEGMNLAEYIRRFGVMSDEAAKHIVYQICLGLRDIHYLGIVHRDINPSNIIIDKYGNARIIDFGISRTNKTNQSVDTQILGTQGYAAPEQYGFAQTNTQSDIYSLGVLINFIKTGALPSQIKADGLLGEISEKCTQMDVSKRYKSVDEIITAIQTGKAYNAKRKYALPGFRQGKAANMIIASIYYLFVVFVLAMYWFDIRNLYESVYFSCLDIIMFFVPVFIFFNYMGWADNLSASKKHSSKFVCVLFGILYEIIAFLILIIIYQPQ